MRRSLELVALVAVIAFMAVTALAAQVGCGTRTLETSGGVSNVCRKTTDRLEIKVSGDDFEESCDGVRADGTVRPVHVVGTIASTTTDALTIAVAASTPSTVTIAVRAADLDVSSAVPLGASVVADVRFDLVSFACTQSISVVDASGRVLLLGSDGDEGAGAPLHVEHVRTHCLASPPTASPAIDLYALGFTAAGPTTLVSMGETGSISLPDGGVMRVRDLRSFFDGSLEGYWDFAWWAAARDTR